MLSANYIRASLNDVMSAPFGDRPCMHEALFDDRWLKDTGLTTLDFAKAMIDEGYHPMTVYFPLIVHGAMLIEPTEVRIQGEPRPVHHDLARSRSCREGGRSASGSRRRRSMRRAGGSTRRAPPGSRCCAGQDLSRFNGPRRNVLPYDGVYGSRLPKADLRPLAPKD